MNSDCINNLWNELSVMSESDPEKYQTIIEESKRNLERQKTLPLPHSVIQTRNKQNDFFHINILVWDRVAETLPAEGALPLCGGILRNRTANVAVNPENARALVDKGSTQDQNDFYCLVVGFVNHQSKSNLESESWKRIEGKKKKKYVGDLAEIQKELKGLGFDSSKNAQAQLKIKTETPTDLLMAISGSSGGDNNVEPEELILEQNTKPLIQEIKSSAAKSKKTEFSQNLQKSYQKSSDSATETITSTNSEIKIRTESDSAGLLKPLSSRPLIRKELVSGKKVSLSQGRRVVQVKVYVPDVERMDEVMVELEQLFLCIQTHSGHSTQIHLPGLANSWKIYETKLSDKKVLSVDLTQEYLLEPEEETVGEN